MRTRSTSFPALRLLIAGALALGLVACGDDDGDDTTEPIEDDGTPEPTADGDETGDGDALGDDTGEAPSACADPLDLGTVVVLGEDFLLADALALGVAPVAATATLGTEFTGIDRDTGGIEPLDQFQLNAEQLAAFSPDLIITGRFYAEQAGADRLQALAETVIVPSDPDWRTEFGSLAAALDRTACGTELLATYDEAVAAADAAVPDDLVVSMGTVYGGENLAAWVDGPVNIPATFVDAGVVLRPGPDAYPDTRNGRAYISTELVGDFDGDVIVLLQTSAVEGEDASLAAVQASGLWQSLPAVTAGRVVTVDRLGYAGIDGRTRLAVEIPELLS